MLIHLRLTILFGVFCSLIYAGSVPGYPGIVMPELMHFIKKKKIILAIYTEDNPPFYYRDDHDETKGIDVDIARYIARSIHHSIVVEVTRSPKTFNDVVDVVSRGEADIGISMLSYTTQRSRKVYYTQKPYITMRIALFIDQYALSKTGVNPTLKNLFSQENQRTLCVIEGSSYQEVAKTVLPHAKLVPVRASSDLLPSLEQGKCFAFLEDDQAIKKRLIRNPRLNLRYKMVILKQSPDPIHIVVNSKYPQLTHFIDQLLMHDDALIFDVDTILKKYAHTFVNQRQNRR